ncbi:MAG TPA: hypothetical protein ENK14_09275 [Caldithrix sp.]|nr:hypothetical protein [Caldithrix sp.]
MAKDEESYYSRHRDVVLAKMNRKYTEDKKYREATKRRAKARYHEDEAYRKATIERAKARYRRLKQAKNESDSKKTK